MRRCARDVKRQGEREREKRIVLITFAARRSNFTWLS